MDYKSAGVDIDTANRAKQMMAAAVRATHGPAVLAGMGAFGGAISLADTLARNADPVLVASTDGVGTKTLIAAALGRYDTVGQDLVNHCIDDLLVQGARPLFFMDYIAAAKLNAGHVAALVEGMALACREAGCALLGGETAEMPDVYAAGAFDLAGTMVGVVSRESLITGETIKPGDTVLALPSSGLHTNGYSLARRVCEPLGYDTRPEELGGQSLGEALLAIHRSYLLHIEALFATDVPIKGLAHITGGGLWENLPRVLPEGVGIEIRRGSWQISPIFRFLVERAGLSEYDAFRTFNMGLGMIVILDAAEVETARSVVPELQVIGTTKARGDGERVRLV
ncbi:MAG TPA: phosphoribosylformylglycinamidine cyclo-ligase [Herpetosiphonaceae bacterium]